MNEFSKEELKDIFLCVDSFRISSIRGERRYGELCFKIQSMINNYCETPKCQHKEIVTGAYPRSNPPLKCDTCGELYR